MGTDVDGRDITSGRVLSRPLSQSFGRTHEVTTSATSSQSYLISRARALASFFSSMLPIGRTQRGESAIWNPVVMSRIPRSIRGWGSERSRRWSAKIRAVSAR